MGKKKKFIDKKTAQHFHVVHRSQRDPLSVDPNASKFVLLSSNPQYISNEDEDDLPDLVPFPQSTSSFGKDLVNELGIVDDGYNYRQHMREIGNGTFYSSNGKYGDSNDLLSRRVDLPEEVLPSILESDRLLDAIAITEDTMDEDLREALINDSAFEEIDDDFVLKACAEKEDNIEEEDDGFDYDAHISKLIEATRQVRGYHPERLNKQVINRNKYKEEEEDDDNESEYESEENKEDIDNLLDQVLLEYQDDEIGELDEEETRGNYELEGDLLETIVEDYITVQQEMLDEEGKIGNPLTKGRNKLEEILKECAQNHSTEDEEETHEDSPENDEELNQLYCKQKEEEQWDCETIVSTYTNQENHPLVIDMPRRKKHYPSSHIQLGKKTGIPLDIIKEEKIQEQVPKQENTNIESLVKCLYIERKKDETKEEKKARKLSIKANKRERRNQKKSFKDQFKQEEQRQLKEQSGNGTSIFKY